MTWDHASASSLLMIRFTVGADLPTSCAMSRCLTPCWCSAHTRPSSTSSMPRVSQPASLSVASKGSASGPVKPRVFSKWTSKRAPSDAL